MTWDRSIEDVDYSWATVWGSRGCFVSLKNMVFTQRKYYDHMGNLLNVIGRL